MSYQPPVDIPRAANGIRVSGRRAGQRFDAEHGVTTEALLFLCDLDPEAIGPSLAHATHYEPTPVGEVATLLAHVPFALARTTFVDLGSGMGRALMEASRYPFRQVVGVEISPALHEVAKENFRAFDRDGAACRDIRLVCADAAAFRFPQGALVVYLYNPFSSEILAPVLARLALVRGEVAVVYHTPVERATIEAQRDFELIAEERFGAVYVRARRSALQRPE